MFFLALSTSLSLLLSLCLRLSVCLRLFCVPLSATLRVSVLILSPSPRTRARGLSFYLTHSFSVSDFLSLSVTFSLWRTHPHKYHVLIYKWEKRCNACTICHYLVSDKNVPQHGQKDSAPYKDVAKRGSKVSWINYTHRVVTAKGQTAAASATHI